MKKAFLSMAMAIACTGALATGEQTFQQVCATCHALGDKGAPKIGDLRAWSKLIKEGQINLTADGYNGVRAMPPKGGRAELSLAEFAEALVYMANQAGANWQAPNEAMLKKINARIDKRNTVKK